MTHPSVHIQSASESLPTVPCWFAEVTIVAHCFTTSGLLTAIEHQVRLARPRFGTYEVLDFVVVLLGYAISAEPTLLAFYDRLTPFPTGCATRYKQANDKVNGRVYKKEIGVLGPHNWLRETMTGR